MNGEDYYYVGKTTKYQRRMEQHLANQQGALWIQQTFPQYVIDSAVTEQIGGLIDDATKSSHEETMQTLKLMVQHGVRYVRGAEYCEVREYDRADANRIQYAVIHHLDRTDRQEIYRGLVRGLTEPTPSSEQSGMTLGGGMTNMSFPAPAPVPTTNANSRRSNGRSTRVQVPGLPAPAPAPAPALAPVSTTNANSRWITVSGPNGRSIKRKVSSSSSPSLSPSPSPQSYRNSSSSTMSTNRRYCIRCGGEQQTSYGNYKKFCNTCYRSWSDYENGDYREKYCHLCGTTQSSPKLSYNNPICKRCNV